MSIRLLQLAWRNLWRNPQRTFITMAAIAFGYVMLLFVACLMAGLRWQMIENGTCLVMSQIQVHAQLLSQPFHSKDPRWEARDRCQCDAGDGHC